jgi:cobalt-zinc-cadmium efflux system outer membrane protein
MVVIGVSSVWAQQAPLGSRLTLQAALDLADKQNLDLAAARQRRAVALAGIRIAKARPNPTFAATESRDAPHQSLLLDQPLELGGKRQRRIDVAQQEGALTEVEIATLARQVRMNARQAFYALAFARAETQRLGEVVKLTQRLREIAEQRYQAGAVAQLEAIQADLEVSRAQADYNVAQQREKVSLSQLNVLLNEPPTKTWELAGSLEDALPEVRMEELTERAYASNYELQHLAQEMKVEENRLKLVKAERIPNLDVQLGLDLNAPHDYTYGPRGGLTLMLPLFYRNQGEIAQSIANRRVLEAENIATKRAVAGHVEAGYYDLRAQQSQVDTYRQQLVPAARKLESMAEESYRAGKTNILSVIDAQRNVQDVERSYLESLVALQNAFATLEQTAGAALE